MELHTKYENLGLTGLVNLGNTCFMNSAIQCLSNTLLLTDYFLTKNYLKDINKGKDYKISIEWYRLLNGIWSDNCTISPNSFHKTFQSHTTNREFLGFRQNDVQEFLVFFIDSLHEALSKEVNITITGEVVNDIDKKALEAMKQWKEYFKDSYSKIIEIFYGQIISSTQSLDNKYISDSYTPMCYFSIPIPTNMDSINIYDCFDLFTSDELLNNENQWYCEDIDKKIDAKKQIKIWSMPKILIVIFKRFRNNGTKINSFINFPIDNLDLSRYCVGYDKSRSKYDLFGICNHSGNHYFSYCKNPNKKWYCYNDSTVNEQDIKNIVTNKAYCLFYKRKN